MTTGKAKTQLKALSCTPEMLAANRLWQSIEQKLNYDGRYAFLNPAESMLRFGRLTEEESDYLGRVTGWSEPFYKGIDWDNVPVPFLAECVMQEEQGFALLQELYPAPEQNKKDTIEREPTLF